jgi:endonuclease YncB( thermonuclease family)
MWRAIPTLVSLVLLFAVAVAGEPGRIVQVIDGDTYVVSIDGQRHRARLENADTPETGERARCPEELEAGNRATAWVREQVATRDVRVFSLGRLDKYQRLLVRVTVDGRDLGELLVVQGLGRAYRGERRMTWCPER